MNKDFCKKNGIRKLENEDCLYTEMQL